MIGVYIKGMAMPTSCNECRFYGEYCYAKGDENKNSKLPCPLIPVPPHGRLGDLDALEAKCTDEKGSYFSYEAAIIGEAVSSAPTIIPADGGPE